MNPIPKPITADVGDPQIARTMNEFFAETKEFVEKTYGAIEPGFKIGSGEVFYSGQISCDVVLSRQISNDRVTSLSYNGLVLAGVFETRTEFNYVRAVFFRSLEGLEGRLSNPSSQF
jgi:hypothetical protein